MKRNHAIVTLALVAISGACGPSQTDSGESGAAASAAAHDVEDQRKYVFPAGRDALGSLTAATDIGGFEITKHGEFDYADIYVDTDGLAVFEAKLSVRFRKATTENATTYKIQVKSEKENAADLRVEVDDTKLAEDRVTVNLDGHGDGRKRPMSEWLDPIFTMAKAGRVDVASKEYRQGAAAIRAWLDGDGKRSAPVKKLEELLRDDDKVKHLRPILVGESRRSRFHIYADGKASTNAMLRGIKPSQMSHDAVAADGPFFLAPGHEAFVWLLEGSYDSSTFCPAEWPDETRRGTGVSSTKVEQLEVENKYRPLSDGTVFMDGFEQALKAALGGSPVTESKYADAVESLYPSK